MKWKFQMEPAYCVPEIQMFSIHLNEHSKVLCSKTIVFMAHYLAVADKYILL